MVSEKLKNDFFSDMTALDINLFVHKTVVNDDGYLLVYIDNDYLDLDMYCNLKHNVFDSFEIVDIVVDGDGIYNNYFVIVVKSKE